MIFKITLDDINLNVNLINKKNMKHCYLRIKDDSLVQISANKFFDKDDATDLIYRKKDWILKHISKKSINLKDDEYYFLGSIYKKDSEDFDLIKYYKDQAEYIITPMVNRFSKEMNLYPTSLKYRNNKSRWGSCSFNNGINLNINLLKFPQRIIEYVVIHELAHIEHKNHSKDFWGLVEKYCADYKDCERFMKSF